MPGGAAGALPSDDRYLRARWEAPDAVSWSFRVLLRLPVAGEVSWLACCKPPCRPAARRSLPRAAGAWRAGRLLAGWGGRRDDGRRPRSRRWPAPAGVLAACSAGFCPRGSVSSARASLPRAQPSRSGGCGGRLLAGTAHRSRADDAVTEHRRRNGRAGLALPGCSLCGRGVQLQYDSPRPRDRHLLFIGSLSRPGLSGWRAAPIDRQRLYGDRLSLNDRRHGPAADRRLCAARALLGIRREACWAPWLSPCRPHPPAGLGAPSSSPPPRSGCWVRCPRNLPLSLLNLTRELLDLGSSSSRQRRPSFLFAFRPGRPLLMV